AFSVAVACDCLTAFFPLRLSFCRPPRRRVQAAAPTRPTLQRGLGLLSGSARTLSRSAAELLAGGDERRKIRTGSMAAASPGTCSVAEGPVPMIDGSIGYSFAYISKWGRASSPPQTHRACACFTPDRE
ncbi:MAG: hypothetical protein ABJA81_09625, partial [Nocardioidaceae bacterium]